MSPAPFGAQAGARIGQLRWRVVIARRDQAPAVGHTGITETLVTIATVWADIQPVGVITYYTGAQVDTPITHRVTIRWLDWLDTNHVITRQTLRQDGTTRTELFRIRRIKEVEGRKDFLEMEVEQETRS